jgi:hypothetical protein
MAERQCGECGLCCKVIGVRELEKAPHVWCRYYRRGKGCEVYESRPEGCAQFACDWLLDLQLDDAWRPDRCGFVLHTGEGGRVLNVDVDPANASAWRKAPFEATLRAWARSGALEGLEVLVWVGRRCWRLDAEGGERDLGQVRPAVTFATPTRARRPGSGRDWPRGA